MNILKKFSKAVNLFQDGTNNVDFEISNGIFTINDFSMSASSDNVFWFRRFYPELLGGGVGDFENYFSDELKVLKDFYFESCPSLFGSIHHRVNKLKALFLATEIGIDVPQTIITNSKKALLRFITKYGRVVTKPLSETIDYEKEDNEYTLFTTEILPHNIDEIPDRFFPTLLQEKIDKEFEIRSFFWNNHFYSMAIFSQGNKQTEVDFRRYDRTRPNRSVPYELPEGIEIKLKELMYEIGLNSGSIDLIKTKQGNYVFLEVNPSGQFGMVSYSCNYNLERIIAKDLKDKDNGRKIDS